MGLSLIACGCGRKDAATRPPAATTTGRPAKPVVPAHSTFDVTWKPTTTVIDAASIAQSYHGVTPDGSMILDGEAAKTIAALPPYSVVVFSGVALRRIARVEQVGSQLHVYTGPATLDDAIANGHIAWQLPFAFNQVAIARPPGFHDASRPTLASRRQGFLIASAVADEAGFHWEGTVDHWNIKINITPQDRDLKFDLDGSIRIGGGGISLHGDGELDSMMSAVEINLANGSTTDITFENSNLHGKGHLTWDVSFDKDHGGDKIKELAEPVLVKLPLGFSLPIEIGPLPFKLEFRSAFVMTPFFTSKVTVAHGESHMTFGGAAGLTITSGAPTPDASPPGGPTPAPPSPDTPAPDAPSSMQADGSIDTYGGTLSIAPLGLSTTLAMPQIVLTLGLPEAIDNVLSEISALGGILGESPGAKGAEGMSRSDALTNGPKSLFSGLLGKQDGGPYFNVMTEFDFIATGPLAIAACERRELKVTGVVGASANLFGHELPVVGPKTVLERKYKVIVPSNIRLCQE